MDLFTEKLNGLLVDIFNYILKFEEKSVKNISKHNLTMGEFHFIECIGKGGGQGRTISDIAQEISVTLSSVTIAINKLVKKGYVQKIKSLEDGRVTYVSLTRAGRRADAGHRLFHEQMVKKMCKNFTSDEKDVFLRGMYKLREFFKTEIDDKKRAYKEE